MLTPSPRLIALLAVSALIAFGADLLGGGMLWIGAGASLLGCLVLLECVSLLLTPSPHITREIAHALPVGVWSSYRLICTNPSAKPMQFTLFDHLPDTLSFKGFPSTCTLPAHVSLTHTFQLMPCARGVAEGGRIEIVLHGSMRLFRQRRLCGEVFRVKVYPNYAAIAGYRLLARENRLGLLGIRHRPRRGEGLEFRQLREYRQGDTLRQIDWKATSRHQKLVSREYQEEKNQQIVILMDCGRTMRSMDQQTSHFDQGLDALLLLSYIALRQGDAVGVQAFNGDHRVFAPRKGISTLNHLLKGLFDLQPTLAAFDFLDATERFLRRQPRRALVVVITNIGAEDPEELLAGCRQLQKRHLVLLANMRETVIDQTIQAEIPDFDAALRYSATQLYLQQREAVLRRVRQQGIWLLDATPEKMPSLIVNRYLDIKRSGQL